MKKITKKYCSLIMVFAFVLSSVLSFVPIKNVSATTILNAIEITSSRNRVSAGELPSYTATTSTEHASIEAYGSNTNWSHWDEGYSSWHGFGSDTPTAVADGTTHYALRLSVELDDGYEFGDSPVVTFNGEIYTNTGYTHLEKMEWGAYLYIDIGIALNEPLFAVTYDFNGGNRNGASTYELYQVAYGPYITSDNFIDFMGVKPPLGKELDAIEINGVRYELGSGYILNCDTTYRYLWKDKDQGPFTLTFDVNGGVPMLSISKVLGEKISLPTPERGGYEFQEWAVWDDEDNPVGAFFAGDEFEFEENTTLHAVWNQVGPETYTVAFNSNGGTDVSSQSGIESGGNASVPISNPTRELYNFMGWYEDAELTVPFNFSKPIDANIMLFARWEFDTSNYSQIEIGGGATSITEANGIDEVTVTFANGTVTISGSNLYSEVKKGLDPNNQLVDKYFIYGIGNITVTANANEGYSASLFENGNNLDSNVKVYSNLTAGGIYRIDPDFFEEHPQPPVEVKDDIEFDLLWEKTFINVWINEKSVMDESDEFEKQSYEYNGVVVDNAGTTDSNNTNTIRLQNRFGDPVVTEYTINGVKYTEDSDGVIVNDEGWFITVPGAAKYTISGVGDTSIAVPRTIIWANVDADKTADEYADDMLLEHGSAKVIGIYDDQNHKVAGESDADENTGMGWVQVKPGDKVVFEFVPEYGYQLTGVSANGFPLEAQDTTNQYTFTMPDANIHFSATFKKVEDVVAAESKKVASGSIQIDGALEGGTAKLTVKDVELSSDKIKGFENAAGDYTISNYLDIDLYNIFYKANGDEDDVWENKIDELDKEVTISIKLEDGIDVNDIVLVHNIHNGEEYEIIEIESYDKETNTITFKTKSFSNYAIATRSQVNNPKTNDGIYNWVTLFTISALGFTIGAIKLKRVSKKDIKIIRR